MLQQKSLTIFQQLSPSLHVVVVQTVHKPLNTTFDLSIEVQSDEQVNLSMSSDVPYLLLGKTTELSKQSLMELYEMSPSVDQKSVVFTLTILRDHMYAADSTILKAALSVSAPGAEA